jgi:voltage-gated potassium channel
MKEEPKIIIWDDIVMMILALISGYILVVSYTTTISPEESYWLDRIDITIALIFLAEFFIKLFLAESKKRFFASNWWYLLASIPVTVPATQALRLLRLLRLSRLFRLHVGIQEFEGYLKRFARQTHFLYMLTVWGIIVFSGTMAFFSLESGINPHVQTLFDSFWWAMATVTTIGYGDVYPITTGGRIVAMFLMVAGIGTSGIFTALIASFLIKEEIK